MSKSFEDDLKAGDRSCQPVHDVQQELSEPGPSIFSEPPPSYHEATRSSDARNHEDQAYQSSGPEFYPDSHDVRPIHQTQSDYHEDDARPSISSAYETSRSVPDSYAVRMDSQHSKGDDEVLEQALEFTRHRATPSSNQPKLQRPVVVPQVAAKLGMPFARAYSPVLQEHGIYMEEFVEFIDNLNVVSTGSPPLQVLDLAGGFVGMVPHHIPQIVGNALSLSAKLGTAGLSKGRSTLFLRKANQDFFAPRGLRMELATGKALKVKLGLDPSAPLVLSLDDSIGLDVQQRRMRALEQYVSPLNFDVPPPNEQTNILEKMSSRQVERQLQSSEKKAIKERGKAMEKGGSSDKPSKAQKDFEKETRKIKKERQKIEHEYEKDASKGGKDEVKALRKREKEMQKLEKEVEKASREFGKETKKEQKDVKKDDKEVEQADQILWILIDDL